MELGNKQTKELADFSANTVKAIKEFYENSENVSAYREWHIKKYGYEPSEGLGI